MQGWSLLSGCCGGLIGAGGFNEFSVAGMGAWALLQFDRKKFVAGPPTFRDLTVVSIGALMLAYWQFQDPYLPSTDSGLTLVEVGKAIIWSIFSLVFFRCSEQKSQQSLLVGISAGLFAYAGATALGSLIYQGPGGGYGNIYNIYNGTNLAGSVICGYAASGALLIISRLIKQLIVPAAILTACVGLQSGARTPLLITAYITIYFLGSNVMHASRPLRNKVAIIMLTAIGVATARVMNAHQLLAISRFGYTGTNEGRRLIYSEGFKRLINALFRKDSKAMVDPHSFSPSKQWHNILFDSYRSNGHIGLLLASAWTLSFISSAVTGLKSKDYLLATISILSSFLLLTGLPLTTGAHELISVLALTLLCNLNLNDKALSGLFTQN